MQGDDAQRGNADGQEVFGGLKQTQQHIRDGHKRGKSCQHKAHCGEHRQLEGFGDALLFPRAEVEGHDGNGGIVQAEQRHKEEALQLEVSAEHTHGGHLDGLEGV